MANKDSDVYKNLVRIEEPEARIHVDAPDGVLPLALNVELPGGYVSEAVPSGVRLPHTATAMFSTADSFQLPPSSTSSWETVRSPATTSRCAASACATSSGAAQACPKSSFASISTKQAC